MKKPHSQITLLFAILGIPSIYASDTLYKAPLTVADQLNKDEKNSTYSDCTARAYGSRDSNTYSEYESIEFINNGAHAYAYTDWANTFYSYDADSHAYGGALHSLSNLTISNNVEVNFDSNYAYAFSRSEWQGSNYTGAYSYADSHAYGGAIGTDGSLNIIDNGNVLFNNNRSEAYYTYGGAIYSEGAINIINNTEVTFSCNYEYQERGFGSSYKYSPGDRSGKGSIRLRSIYMTPDTESDTLTLSAKTGGHITFYDSVYMGNYTGTTVTLNADYQDSLGNQQKATGDIIFSGKYTEDHLKEIKGGTAGTESEITNSRTSSLLNSINLHGGTLRVEDNAVLNTHTITVISGSNATVKITDAELNATSYDITINNSGTLALGSTNGSTKITAGNINIEEDAILSTGLTETINNISATALMNSNNYTIYNQQLGGTINGNLNLDAGSTYIANGANLNIETGTLSLLSTDENKINLILSKNETYEANSQINLFTGVDTIVFSLDDITATSADEMITLSASDYFCGDWINETTSLVYDGSNVFISGVNFVIPEPGTTTLCLLGLTGLCLRRKLH